MTNKRNLLLLASAATIAFTTSCVDDSYNLSDLDTTVGISVNDLTIPLNVDSVVLDKVLELEDGSQIKKQVVNGKEIYAIVEEGTFKSDKIEIPGFTASGVDIAPIKTQLSKTDAAGARTRGAARNIDEPIAIYPISNQGTTFTHSGKVDAAIKGIEKIAVDANFSMTLDVSGNKFFKENIDKICFENLRAKLPKGLEGSIKVTVKKGGKDVEINISDKYNKYTGIITGITGEELSTDNGMIKISIDIDAIDLSISSANEAKSTRGSVNLGGNELVFENGTFTFNGNILVEEGNIEVYSDKLEDFSFEDLPDEIEYICTPELQDIIVNQVSGSVEYAIEGINIDPVKMNDIPDILNQEGTNIKLANPQIYLKLNNPLADMHLRAQTGLGLVAKRDKGESNEASSDLLVIDKADNVFCLTSDENFPKEELNPKFKNAVVKKFAGLDEILSGNGLPNEIEINVVNPEIPLQTISGFDLDQDIEAIEGTYLFFAPLALKDESSVIVYKDTLNDWHDETLDKLSISKVKVNADVISEVPLALELTFNPIDVNGEVMKGVETNTVNIAATKDAQPIEISISGSIKKLDGIIISAKLKGGKGEPLSPANKISLDNLKISVSGKYIDEL
jgi:hypothetical protein